MTSTTGLTLRPAVWAGSLALLALIIYSMTLSPTVSFIDGGELAAVTTTLGIAHPTGYPLFTLLGCIVAHLPVGANEVFRLNAMAAVCCAGAVFLMFLCAHQIVVLAAKRMMISHPPPPVLLLLSAATGTALLAFSETFWAQSVAVEVYSLHLLLIGATLLLVFRARDTRSVRLWYAAAFLLGLSFANHMTTVLVVPGVLYFYYMDGPQGRARWTVMAGAFGFFLLGLTPYLYLPIRAAQMPVMDWGHPVTWDRFIAHLSGKQYRVWIFSSTEVAARQFSRFVSSVPGEFVIVGLVLAAAGLVVLWRAHRRTAVGTMLLFAFCLLYAVNYDIHDIESYFLLAYVCIAFWSACGALAGLVWWHHTVGRGLVWVIAPAVLVAALPVVAHYRNVDDSRNFLVEDYTHNMFASLDSGAVVLSYQWDYWVSAAQYYQLVRRERPDIAVIDKELLRRSWYYGELESRYPWLIRASRAEVDAFLRELYKFEHDIPYAPEMIEGRYAAMIRSFIAKSMAAHPVYVTGEIEPQYTSGFRRVPSGLAFRLFSGDTGTTAVRLPDFHIRPFARNGRLEDFVWQLYAGSFSAIGEQFRRNGDSLKAMEAFARGARLRMKDVSDSASPFHP